MANIYGSDKDLFGKVSPYTSFHAGVFAQFALSNFFSLQPEVLYSRQGFEQADSVFRQDYITIPLLAVFQITRHVSLHLGPQLAMMVSAEEDGKEVDLKTYNTSNLGGAAGLEARFSRFRVGVRYNLLFDDLHKQDDRGRPLSEDIKNDVWQVYVGIGF